MTPQKYIDAVLRIKARQAEYDYLNTSIKDVQGHDFYAHLKPIDNYLLETVLGCLDDALFSMTDVKELASYYVYECMNAYRIKTHGQEYIWRTGEEFEECVLRMIKDKAATDPQTVRALIDEIERYRDTLEFISKKCEQVAEQELHAEVAMFGIYASAQQALGENHE